MVEVLAYAHSPSAQSHGMRIRTGYSLRYVPCGQRVADAALPWSHILSTSTVYRDSAMPKRPLPYDVWPNAPAGLGCLDMMP